MNSTLSTDKDKADIKDPTKRPGYCGSCYGAEERPGQCCNTCDEVRLAYRNKGWGLDSLAKIEQVGRQTEQKWGARERD